MKSPASNSFWKSSIPSKHPLPNLRRRSLNDNSIKLWHYKHLKFGQQQKSCKCLFHKLKFERRGKIVKHWWSCKQFGPRTLCKPKPIFIRWNWSVCDKPDCRVEHKQKARARISHPGVFSFTEKSANNTRKAKQWMKNHSTLQHEAQKTTYESKFKILILFSEFTELRKMVPTKLIQKQLPKTLRFISYATLSIEHSPLSFTIEKIKTHIAI